MARKKKHPEHVNHERWLVSYADFITLLFAFFVVMFAVSQVDSKKLGRFTESFSKAVGIDLFPQPGMGLLPGADAPMPPTDDNASNRSPLPAELEGLRVTLTELSEKQSAPQNLQILTRRNELVVRLSENVLFASGDDKLEDRSAQVVRLVAKQIASHKVNVRVEGHTDDRPIHTTRFPSNWELSTARATAVVRVLAGEGIEATRLSAAGYAEFHPIASNGADDGRKQNRRVDLVVSVIQKEGT